MPFECRVECDSLSPEGVRLTTLVILYPRFIHSEILTHRDRARNSASSRAIPWPKMMARIQSDPVVPIRWGSEQKGMQTGGEIADTEEATRIWLSARDNMVYCAQKLADLGVHKSLCNRLTEPFMWITVVMTATDWKNFFALRCHDDAEIHFQRIAGMMRDAMAASKPEPLEYGQWHLPFVTAAELSDICRGGEEERERYKWVSVGRCARVSYLTHDGKRDLSADVELARRLSRAVPKHASPFEHIATPYRALSPGFRPPGCFRGWKQFRHEIADESVPG